MYKLRAATISQVVRGTLSNMGQIASKFCSLAKNGVSLLLKKCVILKA